MIPISVCIIGINDEETIFACLSSIPKDDFEIIFVDTGSTDNTKKIASQYTDKLFDFPWINDFSAARNFSIQKATHDWILILDCDETITKIDYDLLYSKMRANPFSVGSLLINNLAKGNDNETTSYYNRLERLFHKQHFYYEGSIHEQIRPRTKQISFSTFEIPVEILHSGYIGSIEKIEQKANRNILLLNQSIEKNPSDPYLYYQLGQSYYWKGDYEHALPPFSKALTFDLNPEFPYVKLLIVSYGYTLYHTDHLYDAIAVCEEVYASFSSYANFVFLCGFLYMNASLWEKAILALIQSTTLTDSISDLSTPAYYNLGCIYEILGDKKLAYAFFQKVPDFRDSKSRINKLKQSL
jgi:glycosyltransferase involved in cell wall biosynthesis